MEKIRNFIKKTAYGFLFTLILGLQITENAEAKFVTGSGVKVFPNDTFRNGEIWTTDPGVTSDREEGGDSVVYVKDPMKHSPSVSIGYHTYSGKAADIYIGKWTVSWPGSTCIHGTAYIDTDKNHTRIGSILGVADCFQHYTPGYVAYCADCGEQMDIPLLIYATKETLRNIRSVPNDSFYYYLCPYTANGLHNGPTASDNYAYGKMEQGWFFTHTCSKIPSVNAYNLNFNPNGPSSQHSTGSSFVKSLQTLAVNNATLQVYAK